MSLPILIVGAGPSGLVIALSLLQHGIPVRIIAKEQQYRPGQRGAGVSARTQELHHLLGTISDVLEQAGPLLPRRQYKVPDGVEVVRDVQMEPHLEPTPARPYVNSLMLGQDIHEAILRAHLAKYDCQVELGTELVSLEQNGDHVLAKIVTTASDGSTTETSKKYERLIGADGGRSTVRKQLKDITFLGETRDVSLVVGDIHVLHGLDKDHWHVWGDQAANRVTLRPTNVDDIFNFHVVGTSEENTVMVSSRDALLAKISQSTGRKDIAFGEVVCASIYTPNIRMVNDFSQGRVFLVGDGAHTHSPTGGQGMNTSVQDALNLGWKLALVHQNLASPTLLSSYTAERLPVIAEMLNITTALFNKAAAPGKSDTSAWKRGGSLDQLGVNYRHSPIIVDERTPAEEQAQAGSTYSVDPTQPARAGDRAPSALSLVTPSGKTTSVFELIGPTFHTVLVFSKDAGLVALLLSTIQLYPAAHKIKLVVITPQGIPPVDVAGVEAVVEDSEGHAAKGYSIEAGGARVFAVRPDGVIGAIFEGAGGLDKYLGLVFTK